MIGRIVERWTRTRQQRRSEQARRRLIDATRGVEFCIVASNCLGSRVYQKIERAYNTPFVGLFLHAPCYLKMVTNLEETLALPLTFTDRSRYPEANQARQASPYPIGELGEVEIHFLHYDDEAECRDKWTSRLARMNFGRIFLTFSDRDQCTPELLAAFDRLDHPNKVCFTAAEHAGLDSCVRVPEFAGDACVGDLYERFDLCERVFDFGRWLREGQDSAATSRR